MSEDQIEAARAYVRNRLHAADHANHLGEVAVLRMAAADDLLAALTALRDEMSGVDRWWGKLSEAVDAADEAIAKATGQ